MDTQLAPSTSLLQIHQLLEVHTRLYHNVNEGMDNHLLERPNEMTNHVAWLAGHLVSARYLMLNALGLDVQEPYPGLFAQGKGLEQGADYPDLQTLRKCWSEVSGILLKAVADAGDESLSGKAPFATPTGETVGEFLNFFVHHEAYHLGQLGILRRIFREDALKYN